MNFSAAFQRGLAGAIDWASFGCINTWQIRHVLPKDFSERMEAYFDTWRDRSLDEYYAIPEGFTLPELPEGPQLRFSSPLASPFPENNHATFDLYPCVRGWSAPTMILAHGLMSVSDVGYRRWARRLNEKGWNAVFMHLPYHYSRRPAWQWTGESAVCADLMRSLEGVRQAVIECRILIEILQRQGGSLFGGWGTSYGGWIMGMLGCVEPRLSRLLLVEPIINIESAVWKSPASFGLRTQLKRGGVRQEATARHLRLCCPTHCQPQLPPGKVILIAGTYDFIASPEQILDLHHRWKGSHYAAFPQGHVGYTLMPESFRLAQELWTEDFPV